MKIKREDLEADIIRVPELILMCDGHWRYPHHIFPASTGYVHEHAEMRT